MLLGRSFGAEIVNECVSSDLLLVLLSKCDNSASPICTSMNSLYRACEMVTVIQSDVGVRMFWLGNYGESERILFTFSAPNGPPP